MMVIFRRALHGILLSEWHDITNIISCTLNDSSDCRQWKWVTKLQFTTALYNFLSFRGVHIPFADLWWMVSVPLKIKIYVVIIPK